MLIPCLDARGSEKRLRKETRCPFARKWILEKPKKIEGVLKHFINGLARSEVRGFICWFPTRPGTASQGIEPTSWSNSRQSPCGSGDDALLPIVFFYPLSVKKPSNKRERGLNLNGKDEETGRVKALGIVCYTDQSSRKP